MKIKKGEVVKDLKDLTTKEKQFVINNQMYFNWENFEFTDEIKELLNDDNVIVPNAPIFSNENYFYSIKEGMSIKKIHKMLSADKKVAIYRATYSGLFSKLNAIKL
jgi:hypothetical protein